MTYEHGTDMILTAIEGLGGGVNEINEKINADTIDGLPGRVAYIKNQTSNTTLVNVSGKGALHYAFGEYMNSGSCYKIEIDGNTFYDRNPASANLSCGYFAKESVFVMFESTNIYFSFEDQIRLIRLNTHAINAAEGTRPFAELTQEAFSVPQESENTNMYYTGKPLRFEQSLKITIDGNASEGGYNYIKYTLDD